MEGVVLMVKEIDMLNLKVPVNKLMKQNRMRQVCWTYHSFFNNEQSDTKTENDSQGLQQKHFLGLRR